MTRWALLSTLGLLVVSSAYAQDERPNILLVIIDDLGMTDLGAFGSEIPTPNLDRLALEGLRLTNLHTAANCQSTRLMMMASTSIANAITPFPEHRPRPAGQRGTQLSKDWAIIPELLRDAGYQTYMTGKWDLGSYEVSPFNSGFDRAYALIGASTNYLGEVMRSVAFDEDGRMSEPTKFPEGFYSTEVFTDKILDYIQSGDSESPWFAYLSFNAVHWPLQLPDDWLNRHAGRYDEGYDVLREQRVARATELGVIPDGLTLDKFEPIAEPWDSLSREEQRKYSRAQEIYAGVLEYADMSVGRVVAYLEDSGELDNTLIMVMSDHGGSAEEAGVSTGRLPSRGNLRGLGPDDIDNSVENFGRSRSWIDHGIGFAEAATAPLRQFKATLSEGGIRAPAFVRYPAAVPAGGVSHAFMTVMDMLPTFLEVAGTEHPGAGEFHGRPINDIQGRSMWAHLRGEAHAVHPPNVLFGLHRNRAGALIRGDYKIINDLILGPTQGPGAPPEDSPWRLYNLAEDPGETTDLASEMPELVAELVAEWQTNWRPRPGSE